MKNLKNLHQFSFHFANKHHSKHIPQNMKIEALYWQFDIRLIAKLRDAIKSMSKPFQNTYCTSKDVDQVGFHPVIGHEGPQGEQRYSSILSLTSVIEVGEGSASRPNRILPRERPSTHCTVGWVGLRAGLDRCGKSRPHRDSIPGPSNPQAVAIPTTLPGPQDVDYLTIVISSQESLLPIISLSHQCGVHVTVYNMQLSPSTSRMT